MAINNKIRVRISINKKLFDSIEQLINNSDNVIDIDKSKFYEDLLIDGVTRHKLKLRLETDVYALETLNINWNTVDLSQINIKKLLEIAKSKSSLD